MSPRKRKDENESTETPANTEEPTAAATDTAPAVAEPSAPEATPEGKSFAEKVGQRKYVAAPDPFGIAGDNLARVQLFESKQDRQMALKFGEGQPEDKPSQAVIDKLKEAGYRWNPSHKIWAHPVRGESAMSTRIDAERLYQEVRQMIRQEKGIDTEQQEVPF